ncbi:NADH dehydrogenase [Ochrobactrum daejeonense]|uniref:NADH dehydrogenase n=1 Tax=Brucella daejeonensis TaxID=659015 RepID=A0A7W9ENB8_9HYPH|nr:NAD(P)/FAD-dependent oxidoreductase [Brucella daejeonensis]MBB5704249.1 NADH dehydrogenase [Brucella daejeonensis]
MSKHILIVGAGFAGVMAALAASRLRHEKSVSAEDLKITVVSPEPELVIRPRLYEPEPDKMTAPLGDLFSATDINFIAGTVEKIDAVGSQVAIIDGKGRSVLQSYDRLVLAAGSRGFQPPIPGLEEYGFASNHLEEAVILDQHLHRLADHPASPARDTVVVGGAGFTGLEVATELETRLRGILGSKARPRIIIVDRNPHVAPAMGENPRPYIEQRLKELGIETRLNTGIAKLDENSVTLDNGERIETATVIWSGGMRASPLTSQLEAERDQLGRIIVEPDLRVPGHAQIFATGDTAKAATDNEGNFSLMSCQHARRLGAFAGHNAAAELLGEPTLAYNQPAYVVCLDLGADAAIFTRGWSGKVEITGTEAKKVKQEINTVWIYPPAPDRSAAYENVHIARTVDF